MPEREPNTEAREAIERAQRLVPRLEAVMFETAVVVPAVVRHLEQAGRALEQEREKLSALVKEARRVDAQVREGEEEHARKLAADPSYKPPYAGTIDSTIYLLNLKASAYRIVRALASSPGDPAAEKPLLDVDVDCNVFPAAETEPSG